MEALAGNGSCFPNLRSIISLSIFIRPFRRRKKKVEEPKKEEPVQERLTVLPDAAFNIVLVVDDNTITGRIIERILRRPDWQVLVCEQYEEAIDVASRMQLTIVIVDHYLDKHHTGLDMIDNLRGSGFTGPVIGISADTSHADEYNRHGAVFLKKPIHDDLLIDTVKLLMRISNNNRS